MREDRTVALGLYWLRLVAQAYFLIVLFEVSFEYLEVFDSSPR